MQNVNVVDVQNDIFNTIKSILGDVTVIHDFVIKKNKCEIEVGLLIKKFLDVRFALKIRDNITSIKLKLNNKSYCMYLITSSIFMAIKTICNFIKALIVRDNKFFKKLELFSLTKKEYNELKKNKEKFKKNIVNNISENKEALVICLTDKFYDRRDTLKAQYVL